MKGGTMWDLVRRVEGAELGRDTGRQTVGFAAKMIGVGLLAGLMLTYCNALIEVCFRDLH
jgi:hypothetical protein